MKEETNRFKDYLLTKEIVFPYTTFAIESNNTLIVGCNVKGKEVEVISPWRVP